MVNPDCVIINNPAPEHTTRAAPLLRSHAHPSASATLEAKGARQVVHLRLGGGAAADSAELRRERRRRTQHQHRHGHGSAWSWPA